MKKRTKRGLVVGGAALAIVGGGGAAVAARGDLFGDTERQAFLDDAAKQLNVSPSELQSALQKAFENRIDAAVKAGKITKEQGEALKARAKANGGLALPFFGGGPGFHRGGPGHGPGMGLRHGFHATLDAAATYLGLTEAQLREQLQSGKTLAQIAKAQGKSVEGLKQAMLAEAKKGLDQAVADGRITKEQQADILADLSKRLDDMIQNGFKRFDGPRHVFGGKGHGPSFGFRPGNGAWEPPPSLPPAA